jgi:exosortase E/protease (VPEID-CTERM system)
MNPNRSSTASNRSQSIYFLFFPHHLLGRLYLFGAMVALECIACFPTENFLFGHQRFPRIAIVCYAAFLGLGSSKFKAQQENIPFSRILFGGHLACIGAFFFSTLVPPPASGWLLSEACRSTIYLLGTLLLALALIPLRIWIRTIRSTHPLWLYSSLAGVAAWGLAFPLWSLWDKASVVQEQVLEIIAFQSALPLIHFLLPAAVGDAAAFTLGTPRFSIQIVGACSGIEGLGLIFVFTVVWLWYFRREIRFPRALLLIPCALGCIWLMNVVRLCALILIGDKVSPEVAMVGFHSQFGWISFTVVALAFSQATQKLTWLRKAPSSFSRAAGDSLRGGAEAVSGGLEAPDRYGGESPAIRPYLLPFLAILAAAFVSRAASGYFEWLYPLRFVAAAMVLYFFWPKLKGLNWRFGWFGPVAGVAVFLVWMAPTWFESFWLAHPPAASPLGPALAALSRPARWSWIAFRVAAAVITVPIAEELAFRGYLARRLMSREFDAVSFFRLTGVSIFLSSAVFGLEHMKNLMDWQHLLLGFAAGAAFAAAVRWRGRMGDAVIAHAVCNLLLAAWVLGFGDWSQW